MWSGPRSISTAMMRSWGNRPDTIVCDEPLYAHFLARTRRPDPGFEEILAAHESDWRAVIAWLIGPVPEGKTIFFQKHMAHHLLPHLSREWLRELRHFILIRDPREMIVSLSKVLAHPQITDTGLPQMLELFEFLPEGTTPIVDSADVLRDPARMLRVLCEALGVPFDQTMLSWAPGSRPTDGIWARYWYGNVDRSSGFEPYHRRAEAPLPEQQPLLDEALDYYDELYVRRLRPE